MATKWTLGGDALDPIKLAEFWAAALGYVPEPGSYDDDCASLIDPDGVGPVIGWLRVPEAKTAKNRLHWAHGDRSHVSAAGGLPGIGSRCSAASGGLAATRRRPSAGGAVLGPRKPTPPSAVARLV
ncbi:VOC family protein [Tenggerimyces flavus]|uniref:VOC family protein n=1 Tax=Tenggerimyces flavus TaxID=1708749 RepID=A0ABV7YJ43_9ACTN|nr:VOC family protein [Tenggerimyces flavus]MBM7784165.1 hypothetical protein [Tenggerimyces flavus]